MTSTTGIDPRGPRFAASITAALLLTVVALGLAGTVIVTNSFDGVSVYELALKTPIERLLEPAAILLAVLVLIFAWSATQGVARHPFGLFFKAVIKPRLKPPTELEDPVPPTFAQGIGFVITAAGLVLHLLGVPYALVVAASFAFIAAFLNAVFAYCLGCQIYLLLVRARIIRPKGAVAT